MSSYLLDTTLASSQSCAGQTPAPHPLVAPDRVTRVVLLGGPAASAPASTPEAESRRILGSSRHRGPAFATIAAALTLISLIPLPLIRNSVQSPKASMRSSAQEESYLFTMRISNLFSSLSVSIRGPFPIPTVPKEMGWPREISATPDHENAPHQHPRRFSVLGAFSEESKSH
jgi:hypothetical protein